MRIQSFSIILALGLVIAGSSTFAAPLSGGASGGGAIEGGSGAPGGGVGSPGAIVGNMTAEGIGEDATFDQTPAINVFKALSPLPLADAGQARDQTVLHRQHRGRRAAPPERALESRPRGGSRDDDG